MSSSFTYSKCNSNSKDNITSNGDFSISSKNTGSHHSYSSSRRSNNNDNSNNIYRYNFCNCDHNNSNISSNNIRINNSGSSSNNSAEETTTVSATAADSATTTTFHSYVLPMSYRLQISRSPHGLKTEIPLDPPSPQCPPMRLWIHRPRGNFSLFAGLPISYTPLSSTIPRSIQRKQQKKASRSDSVGCQETAI